MNKLPLVAIFTMLLSGCNSDTSEQKEFIDQVKASTTPRVEKYQSSFSLSILNTMQVNCAAHL